MTQSDDPHQTFEALLTQLGLAPDSDEHLRDTPRRVIELWREILGQGTEEAPDVSRFSAPGGSADGEPVVIRALPFYAMCAHHLLPFFGTFDIVYVPNQWIGGVGSFARVIRHFAQRPQVQERLVQQVADHLQDALDPKGLLIRSAARHLCMEMRGEKIRGELISMASLGSLKSGPARDAAIALL